MEDDNTELLLDTVADDQVIEQPPEDEISIEIEGEEADAGAAETDAMRHMRAVIRDQGVELAKLKKPAAPVEIGKKPDLWDDCEGDPERYEAGLIDWHERKRQAEAQIQTEQQQATARNRQFEQSQISYKAKAQAMGIKNFDAAEKVVIDELGSDYVGAIIQYADDAPKLIAALGTHPALLAKISDEPDPMRRLKILFKMEDKVKVTRKAPPPPEADTIVRGSAPLSPQASDKVAEKLLNDAMKPGGSMNAYHRHMKAKRAQK